MTKLWHSYLLLFPKLSVTNHRRHVTFWARRYENVSSSIRVAGGKRVLWGHCGRTKASFHYIEPKRG